MARQLSKPILGNKLGSRRRSIHQQQVVSTYARQVGEVLFAWNELQAHFLGIFAALLEDPDHREDDNRADKIKEIAAAIWRPINNDSTQRDMVLATAIARLPERSIVLRHIIWLHRMTDYIREYRNGLAHTPMLVQHDIDKDGNVTFLLNPDPGSTKPPVVKKVSAIREAKTWRKIRGDLFALIGFAITLRVWLREPSLYRRGSPLRKALPRRPRLLFVPAKNQALFSARLQQAKKAARRPPPP